MKRPSKAHGIAVSGVACAIATIFLSIGSITPFLLATGYLVACFALMIPISKKYIVGDILAYIAAGLLSLIFGGVAYIYKLLPYFVFFGLHPLLNYAEERFHINKIIFLIVKAAWFDGAMYLCWRFAFGMNVAVDWINEYIFYIIFIGGTVFFIAYDFMIKRCQRIVNALMKKIGR